MSKRKIGVFVALAALTSAAGGAYWFKAAGKPGDAVAEQRVASVSVSIAKVETGPMVEQVRVVGSLYPLREVKITPPQPGYLLSLPVSEGSRVKKGQVLLVIDSTTERAALADAQAQLKLNIDRYERLKELTDRGFGARAKLEEALAQIAAARSAAAKSTAALDNRQFTAPFDGQIGRIAYAVGAYVSPGDVITVLRQFDTLLVDFKVPESIFDRVKVGASIDVHSIEDKHVADGKVTFIDPVIDPVTHSIGLRGEIPNTEGILRPGLFVSILLTLSEQPNALLVPLDAVVHELSGTYVYLIAGGKAERVKVELGLAHEGKLEVLSGVKSGDVVVTEGRFRVRHGTPVKIAGS